MSEAEDRIALIGLLDEEDIDLAAASLALAAADRPGLDVDGLAARVDDYAAEVRTEAAGAEPGWHGRHAALTRIFGRDGFIGDTEQYDDPRNADFAAMLDRRRGLPITLSLLWVAVARRAGWAAEVMNLPGHVLVRLGSGPGAVVADPFAGGQLLGARGVREVIARMLGHHAKVEPEHLAPLSNRAALVRLVNNQATRARRQGDTARALVLHARMTAFAPGFTALWWERARLEQLAGRPAEARRSLAAMLETTHDAGLRHRIRTAMAALARSSS